MHRLPVVSGREVIRALQKIGFKVVAQRGSHIKLARDVGGIAQKVIVPNHRFIKRGTLRSGILRAIDLDVDEFVKLLRR